jgi:hypothetical protein
MFIYGRKTCLILREERKLREIFGLRGIGKQLTAGDCIVGRFMIITAD